MVRSYFLPSLSGQTRAAKILDVRMAPQQCRFLHDQVAFIDLRASRSALYTREIIVKLRDGIGLYFAPKAPEGQENNWLQTMPGKSWFTILRMYGPLEPFIDGTWRPGEIEVVK